MKNKIADPKNYQEDVDSRNEKIRCAGIVIRSGEILLIHRIKDSFEYYVFPGGHVRDGEDFEAAAIREIKEETNIDAKDPKLVFEFIDHKNDWNHKYYLCEWKGGEKPKLIGEEAVRHCEENQFYPMWVDISELEKLNILPLFAREWVLDFVKGQIPPILPLKKGEC